MTLYSANLENIAEPINKKEKKGKKVSAPVSDVLPEPVETVKAKKSKKPKAVAFEEVVEEKVVVKKPKKLSVKQLKKQEEEEVAIAEKATQDAIDEKKQKLLERKKRKAESMLDKEVDKIVEETIEKAPKKAKTVKKAKTKSVAEPVKEKNTAEPPKWFKKYIEGVAVEQNALMKDKKPRTEVKKHADEVAEKSWKDGFTRDRVQTEVDSHMDRMYQMMFSRKLK